MICSESNYYLWLVFELVLSSVVHKNCVNGLDLRKFLELDFLWILSMKKARKTGPVFLLEVERIELSSLANAASMTTCLVPFG